METEKMASEHATNHDYHIVNPSPWPLTGSIGAFIMAIGAILFMRSNSGEDTMAIAGMEVGTSPWLFTLGFAIVLITMYGWWRNVTHEAEVEKAHTPVVQLHLRYGMILFIFSEVMFFVAWFWAYFDASLFAGEINQIERVDLTGGHWPPDGIETFDPWHLPLMNTLILLTSGATVTAAHHYLIEDKKDLFKIWMWATVGLGILFTCTQIFEYQHAAFAFDGHIYGATFFMATGFHGFHVFVGTVFLFVCLMRVYAGHFTKEQHFGFEAAAWYWHFVDVVWLFLFAAIYVWGAGASGH